MLSYNRGHPIISHMSLRVGFLNTEQTHYDMLDIHHLAGPGPPRVNEIPPTGGPSIKRRRLSIDRVRKNCGALLRFDFIECDLVWWLKGEYTNCNVDYDTMFENLDDLRTTKMPPGYPNVGLDQTRETLKDGAPTKGTFTSNFGHACQQAKYNNHKGMHDHIDITTDKFAKEDEKS
jgi:hypothetical protein